MASTRKVGLKIEIDGDYFKASVGFDILKPVQAPGAESSETETAPAAGTED